MLKISYKDHMKHTQNVSSQLYN